MAPRSVKARLADMVEAIERIRRTLDKVSLDDFESDWAKRWLVERGLQIVSEASRHLPDDLKERHPAIPWSKVAGIGNILRHDYERVAAPIVWTLADVELTDLEKVCKAELASLS